MNFFPTFHPHKGATVYSPTAAAPPAGLVALTMGGRGGEGGFDFEKFLSWSERSNLYQYKLDSFATATDHALQGPVGVKAGITL